MRTRPMIMIGLIGLALFGSTVFAQPGGGRPGRATPVSSLMPPMTMTDRAPMPATGTPAFPDISGTATRPFPLVTGTRTLPTMTVTLAGGGFSRATRVPGGIVGTVTAMPDDLANEFSRYMEETYGVSLPSNLSESSPEALNVLTSFTADYLGFVPVMIYGNQADLSSIDSATLENLLSIFPDDLLALIPSLDGIASIVYGGVYKDGVVVVYTGTCSGISCVTTQGQAQFILQEGALGVYGSYVEGNVLDAQAALNLLQRTFPALNTVTLSQPTTETGGYSFTGQTTTQVNRSSAVTVYYVGTYSLQDITLAYAIVGVGEGYAELVRP